MPPLQQELYTWRKFLWVVFKDGKAPHLGNNRLCRHYVVGVYTNVERRTMQRQHLAQHYEL